MFGTTVDRSTVNNKNNNISNSGNTNKNSGNTNSGNTNSGNWNSGNYTVDQSRHTTTDNSKRTDNSKHAGNVEANTTFGNAGFRISITDLVVRVNAGEGFMG
ncbi:hypothetical protein RUND412_004247 [Rhizina undulata]